MVYTSLHVRTHARTHKVVNFSQFFLLRRKIADIRKV